MLLKRWYEFKDPANPSRENVRVRGVKVLRAGPKQRFSPSLIEGGVAEGWLTMAKGRVTIHGMDGDVVYRIERVPGRYPNPKEPAGYEVINFYDCVMEK